MNVEIQTIIDASKKIIIKKTHIIIFLKENKRSVLSVVAIIKELKKTEKGLILILQKNRKIQIKEKAHYPCLGIVIFGEINEIWHKALEEKFMFLPSRTIKLTKEQAFLHAHLCVEKNKDFKISYKGEILNTKKFLYGE